MTLLVCLLLAACTATTDTITTQTAKTVGSPADEALYAKRFAMLRDRTGASGISVYDPLAKVSGASDYVPLAQGSAIIDQAAIDSARAYAGEMNSTAFLIWQDGAVIEETYFGDTTRETLLVSKSLAKPLSVIAVGRAIEEAHITSLDDSVATYIEEWRRTPKQAITIRQLLGMRSGLLPQGAAPEIDNVLNRAYLHPRHDEVIVQEYPLTHTPGSRYEYSNASSELVAVLIERATGVPYEDWIAAQVLVPLGATGGEVWMNRTDGTPHSGCCWMLPAETWLRLAILLIDDGVIDRNRLLPVGYVSEMTTASAENPHAGLGLYIAGEYIERRGPLNPDKRIGQNWHSEPYLAADLYLFDGNSNQVIYIVPSARLVIARLGDRPPRDPEWDNARLPNTILRGLPDDIAAGLRVQPTTP
ncbi:MAG: serine hydrolase [Pseudomonadota bacterium]